MEEQVRVKEAAYVHLAYAKYDHSLAIEEGFWMEPGANQPLQIVLSKNPNSQIQIPDPTNDATSKVIIFTDKEMDVEPEKSQKGTETVVFDRISLISVLEHCKRQGLCSVLLDLRGNYADFEDILIEGFEENLFQKLVVEVLPIWRGSEETTSMHIYLEKRVKNLTSMVSGKSGGGVVGGDVKDRE
ncbi:Riboflavin biosynthesis protein PYRD [Abeliophyllum distichum]|uniref:Riboflavin biosynthesis protein PYRD n=1 Tax=Abeliophyllum distichum TaxID=126358 RepID=A0ABD1QT01_9LAMI